MSLFKKPKKNIRRRVIGSIEEDEAADENDKKMEVDEEENNQLQTNVTKPKESKKERRKQSVLSFEEELNEADDGEVFQVKKSTQSKKMMKLLDKERKKKKEVKKEDEKVESIEHEIKNDPNDLVVIVKPTHKQMPPPPVILNGRAAEVAGCEDLSSSDEDDTAHPRFSKPDHVKLLLESGRIPDAAMIHAARKRRQLAREMGGDYIPIENNNANKIDVGKRLVREEDDEGSDEERITMAVNTAARDRERRREAFMAAQDSRVGVGEESDKGEDDEWESQQIRKGVTGAQLAAVQQETMQYQQYAAVTMQPMMAPEQMVLPSTDVMTLAPGCAMMMPPSPSRMDTATTPQAVASRLRDRLNSLKEVNSRHKQDQMRVSEELLSAQSECKHLEQEKPKLAQKFRYYQELRGYVTDLVECLDEKVPVITVLEQRVLSLLKKRADELIERRRQDVRDQADELAPSMAARSGAAPPAPKRNREQEEARARRAAEREGRRTRRRRAREMKATRHVDGMSSDDEMTELEATAFRNQRDTIESDARQVFSDVVDEFCSIRGVASRFETWRNTDPTAYREAYVSLCLPKVLGPLVRLKMLMWNPLQDGCADLERSKWYDTLMLYGLKEGETEQSLKEDPDLQLMPLIVEKVMLPKLTKLVEDVWDPLSTSQTLRLVGLLNRLIQEYPTMLPSSRHLDQLINAIVAKMKSAVENDIFIPIYPKQFLGGTGGAFFQRQFGVAVKLLRNLLAWQGVVADHVLREVALASLLNRYLLAALRTCDPLDAADKCNMIVSTFPRWWFQSQESGCLSQLQMFVTQVKSIAQCLDVSTPAGREAMENVTNILQSLQAT